MAARDDQIVAAVRGGATSYAAIDRLLGLSVTTAYNRISALRLQGALPDDIARWCGAHTRAPRRWRGRAEAELEPTVSAPTVYASTETFAERRLRFAREAADRTWAMTHPGG